MPIRGVAEPAVLTIKEAAALMKVSEDFLYRLVSKRKGPPVKRFGNRIRFPVIAFTDWLNKPSRGK